MFFVVRYFCVLAPHKEKPVYKPVKCSIFWKGKQTGVENDLTLRKDFIPLKDWCWSCVRGWTLNQSLPFFS